jgi:transposase
MWWRGEPKKIFAYGEPIDMRCSFDGVVAAVKAHLGADPLTGDFYVFVNRRRTLRKGVFWGQTGWCVFAKRPHRGTFEVLREAGTERLVERPGSYVVLRYVRKVVKLKDDGVPSSPQRPPQSSTGVSPM